MVRAVPSLLLHNKIIVCVFRWLVSLGELAAVNAMNTYYFDRVKASVARSRYETTTSDGGDSMLCGCWFAGIQHLQPVQGAERRRRNRGTATV